MRVRLSVRLRRHGMSFFVDPWRRMLSRLWKTWSVSTSFRSIGIRLLSPPNGSTKSGDRYRVRVGDYRIVYRIDEGKVTVLVLLIGHRREVYEG